MREIIYVSFYTLLAITQNYTDATTELFVGVLKFHAISHNLLGLNFTIEEVCGSVCASFFLLIYKPIGVPEGTLWCCWNHTENLFMIRVSAPVHTKIHSC